MALYSSSYQCRYATVVGSMHIGSMLCRKILDNLQVAINSSYHQCCFAIGVGSGGVEKLALAGGVDALALTGGGVPPCE